MILLKSYPTADRAYEMYMSVLISTENNIQKTWRREVRMALTIKYNLLPKLSWLYGTFLQYLLPSILEIPFSTNAPTTRHMACL